MDLDRFKRVNDAFGHVAGDELLKIGAARLREGACATDTIARPGGDGSPSCWAAPAPRGRSVSLSGSRPRCPGRTRTVEGLP
ncbi:diguanylate cyclase [Pseudofrankia inefficax]|uniref:diguanylate cyclase n=1 Tax=Pseudofrankia inefficax (strain DSM 45817 / CECT 9037 / DDB 130130 / EuI1c) TaxID=298654 RepID=UPI0034A57D5C